MGRLSSSNLMDNEILKCSDLNNGFNAQIENITKALSCLLEPNHDFVIAKQEIVEPHSTTNNDWSLNINPILGISNGKFFLETEKIENACSVNEPSDYDRFDIVEARSVYVTLNSQQRAFIDFDTKSKSLGYVNVNKELQTEFRVVQNPGESVSAPYHTEGWVKIAEIFVPSKAQKISDCTIYNITSDIAGLNNEGWTNEKDATYNIRYMSEINERQRAEHHQNGEHKENVIHLTQLDTGLGENQVNGNNIPIGGESVVSDTNISAAKSIYETLSVVIEKINDLYKEYLKDGKYKFNRELVIKGDDSDIYEKNPLKVGLTKSGTAYLKLGDATLLTIFPNGILRANKEYVPENEYDLIPKKVTNLIEDNLSKLTSRVQKVETDLDQSEYTNEVLGRYKIDNLINIKAATNRNINLADVQTIDNVSCEENDTILVIAQNNAKENGIYTMLQGAWKRHESYLAPQDFKYKLLNVKKGQINKNKIFYCPIENFTDSRNFGSDDIKFITYFGSVNPLENSLAIRDDAGHIKSTPSVSTDDVMTRSEVITKDGFISKTILEFVYPVGSLYWTSSTANPREIFGIGTWKQIKDKFILAVGDYHPLDSTGGTETVTLSLSEIPSHNHSGVTANGGVDHQHYFSHTHLHGQNVINVDGDGWDNTYNHAQGPMVTYTPTTRRTHLPDWDCAGYECGNPGVWYGTDVDRNGWRVKTDNATVAGWTGGANSYVHAHGISADGGSRAHNNMPPFVAKYCWERIS